MLAGAISLLGQQQAESAPTCDFGPPVSERVVLSPRPGTFYSADVLNPDVVRVGRR